MRSTTKRYAANGRTLSTAAQLAAVSRTVESMRRADDGGNGHTVREPRPAQRRTGTRAAIIANAVREA